MANLKMKHIILVFFIIKFLIINYSWGQPYIPILHDSILVEGIYKNFEEFKLNKPSIITEVDVQPTYSPLAEVNRGDQCYMKRKDSVEIEMNKVWGFSDGKDVYIKQGKGPLALTPLFNKIKYFGRYCYYDVIKDKEFKSANQDFFGGSTNYDLQRVGLVGKIIDLQNGKEWYIKSKIYAILKEDPALLQEYLSEENTEENDISYIIKYSEKHIHELF